MIFMLHFYTFLLMYYSSELKIFAIICPTTRFHLGRLSGSPLHAELHTYVNCKGNTDLRSGLRHIPEEGISNVVWHVGNPYLCDTVRHPTVSTRNICTNTSYTYFVQWNTISVQRRLDFLTGRETFEINVNVKFKMKSNIARMKKLIKRSKRERDAIVKNNVFVAFSP
jgi:hypothetical protein